MLRLLYLTGLLLIGLCGSALPQGWPSKPIHVVVPFTAGSTTDIVARTMFEQVGKQTGHAR